MNISFKDSTCYINDICVAATSADISENISYSRVDDLGYANTAQVQSSHPQGQFSINGYVDTNTLRLKDLTGFKPITGRVGYLGFTGGFLSSFSISSEPMALMTFSMTSDFFSKMRKDMAELTQTFSGQRFAHSALSTVETGNASLVLNHRMFSVSIELSQETTPKFKIGSNEVLGYDFGGGSIKVSLQGSGLQHAVQEQCENSVNFVLNLQNLCNEDVGEIRIEGLKVSDSSVSVDGNDGVNGKVDLVGYF